MSPENPATSEKPATFASFLRDFPTTQLGKTRDLHAYLCVFTRRPRKNPTNSGKKPQPPPPAPTVRIKRSPENPRSRPPTIAVSLGTQSKKPTTCPSGCRGSHKTQLGKTRNLDILPSRFPSGSNRKNPRSSPLTEGAFPAIFRPSKKGQKVVKLSLLKLPAAGSTFESTSTPPRILGNKK